MAGNPHMSGNLKKVRSSGIGDNLEILKIFIDLSKLWYRDFPAACAYLASAGWCLKPPFPSDWMVQA
jgi:hypothetical protein